MPTANIKELRGILAHVKAHPQEWHQGDWATKRDCGTTYCIAGHAVHRAGWKMVWREDTVPWAEECEKDGERGEIEDIAQDILGLTDDQAGLLFYSGNEIEDFEEAIDKIVHPVNT